MVDENRAIKELIKLQKQRPAFSRMISWEISQAAQYQPVKKGKRKKKKTSSTSTENFEDRKDVESPTTDDNETTSDDSSEYETACEEEEVRVRGQSFIESEGHFDDIICTDMLDSVDNCFIDSEDDDDLQEDDLYTSCMGNDATALMSSAEPQQGRKRQLSKKQKRKRRTQFKECLDGLYNLGNLFDATEEISDVFSAVLAAGPDVEIQQRVPTLVELCLKVNRRRKRHHSEKGKIINSTSKGQTTVLPYGMKKMISCWGLSQKQLKKQLSFLLNKVLPLVEDKMGRKEYVKNIQTNTNKNPNLVFPKRSVWANLPIAPIKFMLQLSRNGVYGSEETSSFLFTPSAHDHGEIGRFRYEYESYYQYDNVILNNAMWVLGTTIDLMLPRETGTASTTRSVLRIKRALTLRYKSLVDILFENTIPYVMWTRGKIVTATIMFRNLIEKERENDTKAMYLSEIARMHAIFGNSKTAEQFYRLATETALDECNAERRDRCINEATEQNQILLASIYDTGVLDEEKALQSYRYWTGVKNLSTVRTSTLIAGLDALLCYHLSHLPGSKPYDEAIAKVEKLTEECKYAYYYQSMLYALNGTSDMSTKLYRESSLYCSITPGEAVLPYIRDRDRNPWQPIIDLVKRQTKEVKPLLVIWRTNLQPPRITTHGPMEGQVNSEKLNLRLNDAGHVTGDMQMMMPPLRDISLNAYTGFLMTDNQPSQTGIWTSAYLAYNDFHFYDLLVPTYRLIFSGDDGTTVHMLKPSNSKTSLRCRNFSCSSGPPCPFTLHWKSPDGQVAKLNLHALLKNKVKEFVSTAVARYKRDLKAAEKAAEIAKKKKELQKIGNIENEKMPEKSLNTYLEKDSKTVYFNWKIISEPYVFGKTVLLLVKRTDKHGIFYVVVNTENKNTFLSSNIPNIKLDKLLPEQFRNNYTEEEYFMTASVNDVHVMNTSGNSVLTLRHRDIATAARNGSPPVLIYPKLFGVSIRKDSIWCVLLGQEKENDLIEECTEKICWTIGSLSEELNDHTGNGPCVKELTYIGKNVSSLCKLLMANFHSGLAFINPNTMEYVPIQIKEGCAKHFEFTKGNNAIKGDFEGLTILTEKIFALDNVTVYRVAFGVENKVFVLEINNHSDDSTVNLEMICCIVLPGLPKEVCFVGRKVGMLISFTQHSDKRDEYYREHMFHFDFDGHLHGVLLCLSHGPRSFLPVYYHGNTENDGQGEGTFQGGWHVYLRDGRDGIICIRLQ